MDYLCNVEQQQTESRKKRVVSNAVPAIEELQHNRKNVRYFQKGLTSLDQFLAPSYEHNQHMTHKNTQNSTGMTNEAHIENRHTVREAISQHRERNVTSKESKSKNEDLTLASLLGYPKVKANFENRNNKTSKITTSCSSRHVRVQPSLSGVEMNIGTKPAYLTFNDDCAATNQTSYVCGAPSSEKIDSTSRLYDTDIVAVNAGESLRKGEGNDMFYENCGETDDEMNTPWWLNSEYVHMGDVHRAVSEFLSGSTGYGLQTQKIKEEIRPIANESESVETNNLESSDILDGALNALVDSDYSIADNESCRIQNNSRENVPIFVLSDDSNTLSEGNETCMPTSWGHMREGTPLSVNNKRVNIINGAMYTCNICDKVFSKLATVQNHIRMHLGIRLHACSRANCEATFTSANRLNLHMRVGHGRTSDTTSRPSVVNFRDAVTVTHGSELNADACIKPSNDKLEVFPCSKCDKQFKDSGSLLKHITSHSIIRSRSRECQSCGESFLTYYARQKHLRDINSSCYKLASTSKKKNDIHEPSPIQTSSHPNQRNNVSQFYNKKKKKKRYQCKECDQTFTKERRLMDHVCFGTGADLYTCHTCSETFVRRSALTRHFKNHCVA